MYYKNAKAQPVRKKCKVRVTNGPTMKEVDGEPRGPKGGLGPPKIELLYYAS